MVTYAFICRVCHYEMEVGRKMGTAESWLACPICFARMLPISRMGRVFTNVIRSFIDIPPKRHSPDPKRLKAMRRE